MPEPEIVSPRKRSPVGFHPDTVIDPLPAPVRGDEFTVGDAITEFMRGQEAKMAITTDKLLSDPETTPEELENFRKMLEYMREQRIIETETPQAPVI